VIRHGFHQWRLSRRLGAVLVADERRGARG
jgi:hypothetical protein